MEAKILKADGLQVVSTPKEGTKFTLEELQEIVGGFIEQIYLDANTVMILNEEGKLRGLPFNLAATHLARTKLGANDFVVGNVLICSRKQLR